MKPLPPRQADDLLRVLKTRFAQHMHRHRGVDWADVQSKLIAIPKRLWALHEMERTGGEPDVVAYGRKTREHHFYDCSIESPLGRRSLCYDRAALESRKENKPAASAIEMAAAWGVDLLTEREYRALQEVGAFDMKTSSWIQTPAEIRKLGGALFCDRRYNTVFVYHNGAESYYAARGFRASLKL